MTKQNKINSMQPVITGLQLDSESLGDINNSVNLFRGDVNFSFNLISLNGGNGLNVNIRAFYGSNVRVNVQRWNMESQRDILGVGWSMPYEKIVVDPHNTGTTYNDDFYLITGGATIPMYRSDSEAYYIDGRRYIVITFQLRDYQFWKISYYPDDLHPERSRWEIIKEDGSKFIYGLKGIQWGLRWHNWIGSTTDSTGRQYPIAWNLVEVLNLWGESIKFEYENDDVKIGTSDSSKYTRYSRISSITDVLGQKLFFHYKDKESFELQFPHVPPHRFSNAFQFQFEQRRLDFIEVMNDRGGLLFTTIFKYDFFNVTNDSKDDNYKKGYLVSAIQKNDQGDHLPDLHFEYYTDPQRDIYPGAIKSITYPKGGRAAYVYESQKLPETSTQKIIHRPDDNYVPGVWYGPTYVVITWHNNRLNNVKLNVYKWGGSWIGWDGEIDRFTIEALRVLPGNGFFAVYFKDRNLGRYRLWLYKENPYRFGEWLIREVILDSDFTSISITVGNDFVAFKAPKSQALKIVQWDGKRKKWTEITLNTDPFDHIALAGGSNFCLAGYYRDGRDELILQLYYSNEKREWITGDRKIIPTKIDWQYTNKKMLLTTGGSFGSATYVKEMKGDLFYYDVLILQWREDFTFAITEKKEYEQNRNLNNPFNFSIINDNVIGNAQNVFRFDGQKWQELTSGIPRIGREYGYAYGSDLTIRTEKQGRSEVYNSLEYNPYQSQWSEGSLHGRSDASQGTNPPTISNNFCTIAHQIYYRDATMKWNEIHTLPNDTDLKTIQNRAPFYISYQLNNDNTTYVLFLKDGKVRGTSVALPNERIYIPEMENQGPGLVLAGPDSFITYRGKDFNSSSELFLRRVVNESIEEVQVAYVVSKLGIDDGYNSVDTFYAYDKETAAYDPNGRVAQYVNARSYRTALNGEYGYVENIFFNGLKPDVPGIVYPDTDNYTNVKDYFSLFNGNVFKTTVYNKEGMKLAESVNYLYAYDKTQDGNDLYGIFARPTKKVDIAGLFLFIVDKKLRHDLDKRVFSQEMRDAFTAKGFNLSYHVSIAIEKVNALWLITDQEKGREFCIALEEGLLKVYGYIESVVESDYNKKGQISRLLTYNYDSEGNEETLVRETGYAWEVYKEMEEINLLVPKAEEKSINETKGVITGISVNTYRKEWGGVKDRWASHKSYLWDGSTGTEAFDFNRWSGNGEPPKGWLKTSEIIEITDNGRVLESADIDNIHTSFLYDSKKRFKVAQFQNAAITGNEVSYYGFESYEDPQSWAILPDGHSLEDHIRTGDAHSGTRALRLRNMGLKAVFRPNRGKEKFLLTCWIKTDKSRAYNPTLAGWVITLKADLEKTVTLPVNNTNGKWQYFHYLIDPEKTGVTPVKKISLCIFNQQKDVDLLVDSLCFAPFEGYQQFSATVYDDYYLAKTATLGIAGETIRTIYDILRRPVAMIGNNEIPKGLSSEYLWRQSGDKEFSRSDPNMRLNIAARTGGIFDDFHQGDIWKERWRASDGWRVLSQRLAYEGGKKGTLLLKESVTNKKYGIRFSLTPEEEINQAIGITIGTTCVVRWAEGKWELYDQGKIIDSLDCPKMDAKEWLLIAENHGVLFFANGRQIFSHICKTPSSGQLEIFTSNKLFIEQIIILIDPITTIEYIDNTGRTIQDQALDDSAILVSATGYNKPGKRAITTKTAKFDNTLFKYKEDFVSAIDWKTGKITGRISDHYPDDEGYPYSRIRLEDSPLSRRLEDGLPGKTFAINREIPEEDRHTTRFIHACKVNNGYIDDLPAGEYIVNTTIDPDKIPSHEIKSKTGAVIAAIKGKTNAGEGNFTITRNYYDAHGNVIKTMLPNSFQKGLKDHDKFVINMAYDFFGRITRVDHPDTTGPSLYLYDKAGRIRFMQDAAGGELNYILYWKYDKSGRTIEEGVCDYKWDDVQLRRHADERMWIPRSGLWKKKYIYDGDGEDLNLTGKLVRVLVNKINNRNRNPKADVEESYFYNMEGELIKKHVKVYGYDNGDLHISGYDHDNMGNIITVSYNEENGEKAIRVSYEYDNLGQVSLVEVKDGKDDRTIPIASYTYNPDGAIVTETLNPGAGFEVKRKYTYNSPGWPTQIKDNYLTETLDYSSRYSGLITRAGYKFENIEDPGDFVTEYTCQYRYDQLGRLTSAKNNKNDNWSLYIDKYDSNGNMDIVKRGNHSDKHEYYWGTDRLKNIDGSNDESYNYNPNGSIKLSRTGNITNITYDPVSEMATVIETERHGKKRTTEFQYSAGDRRVLKTTEDQVSFYLLNKNGNPLIEKRGIKGGAESTNIYVYGLTGLTAIIKEGKVYNLIKDHINSTRVVLLEGTDVYNAYNYQPFGDFMGNVFENPDIGQVTARLFTGQELDIETGLYNFNARLYDSFTGRFYSMDPKGQFSSPYIYGGNNPVSMIDPSGEIAFIPFFIDTGIGALIGGVSYVAETFITSEDFHIGQFFTSIIAGAASGATGYGAGVIASKIARPLTSYAGAIAGGAFGGAATDASVQYMSNVVQGQPWHAGLIEAGLIGGTIGGITGGISTKLLKPANPDRNLLSNAQIRGLRPSWLQARRTLQRLQWQQQRRVPNIPGQYQAQIALANQNQMQLQAALNIGPVRFRRLMQPPFLIPGQRLLSQRQRQQLRMLRMLLPQPPQLDIRRRIPPQLRRLLHIRPP